MKKIIYTTVLLTLAEGLQLVSKEFPKIKGNITDIGTSLIGDRKDYSAQLSVTDNGNEILKPLDVSFTETKGRESFLSGLIKVNRNTPGEIQAIIKLDKVVAANDDFKIEVLVVSEIDDEGPATYTPQC